MLRGQVQVNMEGEGLGAAVAGLEVTGDQTGADAEPEVTVEEVQEAKLTSQSEEEEVEDLDSVILTDFLYRE